MTVKVTRPEFDAVEKLKELDSPKGVAGEALLRADPVREQQNLLGIRGKNILYNGAMNVSQRYTSFSGITSATDYYVCDRWSLQTSLSGSLTVSQDADGPPEFQNCYKINVNTADPSPTTGIFRQHLQGDELQFLKYGTPEARDMTLSFWVKSNATGMYGFDIEQYDGTNYQIFVANYDINQPDVWEYKTIKIPGNPHHAIANDSYARFNLHWWFAFNTSTYAGGNRKTDTWQPYTGTVINDTDAMQLMAKAGNYIKFTGVQLELGSVATPFERRNLGEELVQCMRYYQRSKDFETNEGVGAAYQSNRIRGQYERFFVPMREDPAITLSGARAYVGGGWQNASVSGGSNISYNGFSADLTGTYTNGYAYPIEYFWEAEAEL